jgi:hypothetical protein
MADKGLCISCVKDKECTFIRRYPVIQCEEFTDCAPRPVATRQRSCAKRSK